MDLLKYEINEILIKYLKKWKCEINETITFHKFLRSIEIKELCKDNNFSKHL